MLYISCSATITIAIATMQNCAQLLIEQLLQASHWQCHSCIRPNILYQNHLLSSTLHLPRAQSFLAPCPTTPAPLAFAHSSSPSTPFPPPNFPLPFSTTSPKADLILLSFLGPPMNNPNPTIPPKTHNPLFSLSSNPCFGALYSPPFPLPLPEGNPISGMKDLENSPAVLDTDVTELRADARDSPAPGNPCAVDSLVSRVDESDDS